MSEQRLSIAERLGVARAARDEGMQQAETAADSRILQLINKGIEDAIASGVVWSANTIRDLVPAGNDGLLGARINSYSMRKVDGHPLVVCVGDEPSTLKSTHNKRIKRWISYDAWTAAQTSNDHTDLRSA